MICNPMGIGGQQEAPPETINEKITPTISGSSLIFTTSHPIEDLVYIDIIGAVINFPNVTLSRQLAAWPSGVETASGPGIAGAWYMLASSSYSTSAVSGYYSGNTISVYVGEDLSALNLGFIVSSVIYKSKG